MTAPRQKPKTFEVGMYFKVKCHVDINDSRTGINACDPYKGYDLYEVVGIWTPDENAQKHLAHTTKKAIHLYGEDINGIKYVYVDNDTAYNRGVEYIKLKIHGCMITVYACDCLMKGAKE